jgi:hypothetical protein
MKRNEEMKRNRLSAQNENEEKSLASRTLPISVDASCSATTWIVSIVDHAIDNGCEMFRYTDDQSPRGQFVGAQMHGATGADLHRRSPDPAERLHDSLDGRFVYASSRVALAALPRASALVGRCTVYEAIDLLVRETGRDGD